MSLILGTENDENPSTFRQNEQDNTTNNQDNNKLDKLECDKSLTISSGGYENNLPSPMNYDKGKINFDKNVSEINFGRLYNENIIKTNNNKNNNKNNEEFLKFIADNSGI